MSKIKQPEKFTLIEMLVVISIISILAALLMPALDNAITTARTLSCSNNLHMIDVGLSMYANDNYNKYPAVPGSDSRIVSDWSKPVGIGMLVPDYLVPIGTVGSNDAGKGLGNERSALFNCTEVTSFESQSVRSDYYYRSKYPITYPHKAVLMDYMGNFNALVHGDFINCLYPGGNIRACHYSVYYGRAWNWTVLDEDNY